MPCDTARPDTTCDCYYRNGQCENDPPNAHWGHIADNGAAGGREGRYINEGGYGGVGGGGSFSMPVWCCSN